MHRDVIRVCIDRVESAWFPIHPNEALLETEIEGGLRLKKSKW